MNQEELADHLPMNNFLQKKEITIPCIIDFFYVDNVSSKSYYYPYLNFTVCWNQISNQYMGCRNVKVYCFVYCCHCNAYFYIIIFVSMRTLFVLILVSFSVVLEAQNGLQSTYAGSMRQSLINNTNDSTAPKKWFISKYVGVSSGIGFFNGGNATILSVPVGLQLNRRLTNNWYAFAGVSAAPAYVNFNHSFLSGNTKVGQPNNYFLRSNRFDVYSRAELGLMYVNDQKTFSISGSIGVERSSYPLVPLNQVNVARPNAFVSPNK